MIDSTIQQQVVARTIKDVAFRRDILSTPKATLAKEYHIHFPESVTIRVLEDTPTLHTLVLPPQEVVMQELTDAELEEVAGAIGPASAYARNCETPECR
jgi:hypothetical protein